MQQAPDLTNEPVGKTLAGKVALVTGAASGIGAACAQLLAQRGAVVVLSDLPSCHSAISTSSTETTFMPLDVTDEVQWSDVLKAVLGRWQRLDVLVNAAGIVGDVRCGTLEATTLQEWRRVLAVNLDGTFLGCKAAVGAMRPTGRGSIVNLSSIGAYYPTSQSIAYGASKGAVTQLTKSVALFASAYGPIRCNSVHPGRIATPMLEAIAVGRKQRQAENGVESSSVSADRIPLGPHGDARDVAHLVAFLASDEAAYITGSEFSVDGGWHLLR